MFELARCSALDVLVAALTILWNATIQVDLVSLRGSNNRDAEQTVILTSSPS